MRIYLQCDSLNQQLGIVKARINEGINFVTIIDLELASAEEIPEKDFDGLIGKPITVIVEDIVEGKQHKARFDGVIYELIDVAAGKDDGGIFYYTMVVRPALWSLNYFAHSRSYTNKSRIEVIDELLAEHDIALDENYVKQYLQPKIYPSFPQLLQTGTSDLTFFQRTLANAGISYYFSSDYEAEEPERLHLVDDNAFFPKYETCENHQGGDDNKPHITIADPHGMSPSDAGQRRVETITRLTRAIPGAVSSTAYLGDGSTRPRDTKESQENAGIDGEVQVFVPEGGNDVEGAARHTGKIVSEGFQSNRVVYRGVSDHLRIRPGYKIPFKDLGTLREYSLLIVNVQHSFSQTPSASLDEKGGSPDYKNYFIGAKPNSNVRPSTHNQTDVDIDLSLENVLDIDIDGRLSINPKFRFNPHFDFNPTLEVEVNAKAISFLVAAIAALQAQIVALRAKVGSLGSGDTCGGTGLVAAKVEKDAWVTEGKELVCLVRSEEFAEPITAKVAAYWHTASGGTHFLPRKGNHVWIMNIRRSRGNDWVVVGYRPSSAVGVTNDPAKSTTIKTLVTEGPPEFEAGTNSIIGSSTASVPNRHRLGIMGEGNIAEMFVADTAGHVVARATENIYEQASNEHQIASKTHLHAVSGDAWQEFGGSSYRTVGGDQKESITGTHEMTVCQDQKIGIGGNQNIHVKLAQDVKIDQQQTVSIGTGQEITVAKGDRKISVNAGNVTENIVGDRNLTVSKKNNVKVLSDNVVTWLGDDFEIKGANKNEVVYGNKIGAFFGTAEEGFFGAKESLSIGAVMEQNLSKKYEVKLLDATEILVGPAKRNAKIMEQVKIGAIEMFETKIIKEVAKLSNKKVDICMQTGKVMCFK